MLINNKTKKGFVIFVVLMLTLAMFASCGDEDVAKVEEVITDEEEVPVGDVQASLTIKFPKDSGETNVEKLTTALPTDGTVLDLIWAYANDNNVEMNIDDSDADNPYITQIGSVKSDKKSGWTFTVNGEQIMKSAGQVKLEDGDEVVWEFTTF